MRVPAHEWTISCSTGESSRCYRVATAAIRSDVPLPLSELVPSSRDSPWGSAPGATAAETAVDEQPPKRRTDDVCLFDGEGYLGGRPRKVRCDLAGDGYRLEVEELGSIRVDLGGRVIQAASEDFAHREALLVETVLGPALALALAEDGVFGLHASALRQRGRGIVAFAGASGQGKSRLARVMSQLDKGCWARFADDVIPWALDGAKHARTWSTFPQLKLAPEAWPDRDFEAHRLRAILFLERSQPNAIALLPVAGAEAMRDLLGQSVASRLLRPERVACHFNACASLVGRVPLFRLRLPEGPLDREALSELLLERVYETAGS